MEFQFTGSFTMFVFVYSDPCFNLVIFPGAMAIYSGLSEVRNVDWVQGRYVCQSISSKASFHCAPSKRGYMCFCNHKKSGNKYFRIGRSEMLFICGISNFIIKL